jgi:hypothetical protein
MRRGDRAAAGTADHVVRGLHGQLELAVVLVDGNQPEPVETQDYRPQVPRASSIRAHLGPPSEVSKHHEE